MKLGRVKNEAAAGSVVAAVVDSAEEEAATAVVDAAASAVVEIAAVEIGANRAGKFQYLFFTSIDVVSINKGLDLGKRSQPFSAPACNNRQSGMPAS
jgi:hypothetical protein